MKNCATLTPCATSYFSTGEIGTWRHDPDTDLYTFSSELSLGHEQAAQPVPRTLLQVIQHTDDRAKDTAIRERITREGGRAEGEMRYRQADRCTCTIVPAGSWPRVASRCSASARSRPRATRPTCFLND